jgi:hypothetical protein
VVRGLDDARAARYRAVRKIQSIAEGMAQAVEADRDAPLTSYDQALSGAVAVFGAAQDEYHYFKTREDNDE